MRALNHCLLLLSLLLLIPVQSLAQSSGSLQVVINGKTIKRTAELSPDFPIYATFSHSNPSIVKVKLEYKGDIPSLKEFKLGKKYKLKGQEKNMASGNTVTNYFISIDADGIEYDKLKVTFIPKKGQATTTKKKRKDKKKRKRKSKKKEELEVNAPVRSKHRF